MVTIFPGDFLGEVARAPMLLEARLLGLPKFRGSNLPVFQRPSLREGRELGVLMLRGCNLSAFQRLGLVEAGVFGLLKYWESSLFVF
ncbi:hypothetical protein KKG71_02935 [Patescibacteria group bacterium]|nr:hypothetical protein [Patescibacteria group bacterium]